MPILGSGPTFTTQFDNTWGPHVDGGFFQWLGVKGDNATAGQDQKESVRACCIEDECSLETGLGCMELGGMWIPSDETCAPELCATGAGKRCFYILVVTASTNCVKNNCPCNTGDVWCGPIGGCTNNPDSCDNFVVNVACPGGGSGICHEEYVQGTCEDFCIPTCAH